MMAPDFEALAQAGVRGLRAYDPGHDLVALRQRFGAASLLELGSNENSHGPSPTVHVALAGAMDELHRYPDPLGSGLKRALATHVAWPVEGVMLGNGSHELLMQIAQVFAGAGQAVLASQYGFAVYALAAQAAGARFVAAPALSPAADQPRGHDLHALLAAIGDDTAVIYLANPNNPTGTWFPTADLRDFLQRVPARVLVVVDEAYLEYVTDPALESASRLLGQFPNLLVTRTFSKAYGLAGLRVGYLLAQPGLVAILERIRESFNVNALGLVAAQAALADAGHVQRVRVANAQARTSLRAALLERGVRVAESQTNFLLLDFGQPAAPIEAAWLARGLVARPMAGYGLPDCLRLTVGTDDENRRLLAVMDQTRP